MAQEARKPRHSEPDQESLSRRFRLWLRANISGRNADASLKEAIEEVLEEHEEEGVEELRDEEQKMLKKVLNFGVLEVSDIMTPRSDIKAVECNISLADLKEHLVQNFHTRVPVYNDTLDNIKGFIHVKDLIPLFAGDGVFNMAFVLRDVLFVPPSMKLTDLLLKMRAESVHIAIVVDEYGGTDGLVTLEDIFEEIVGDIQDEHDEDDVLAQLTWNAEGFCDVDARARIEALEQALGLSLHEEDENADYDTLGGLIFYKLAHVPIDGEVIEYRDGVRFEILSADPRMIKMVRIFKKPEITTTDVE
ncbi:MAG TPA: hemolysin family protein [Rickettsiales bacterium]|nr:hemolysin family protein [Rickettsiales bacterium]